MNAAQAILQILSDNRTGGESPGGGGSVSITTDSTEHTIDTTTLYTIDTTLTEI
jgi:hypothetical protein